jgi:trehalose 6-phosphate synthase
VTPLRDGMNLVAKEYVASQNPDDPGVLILSRFAGAAQECKAGADRFLAALERGPTALSQLEQMPSVES